MEMKPCPLEELPQIKKIYLFPCEYEIAPFLFGARFVYSEKKLKIYVVKENILAVLTGVGRKNILRSLNSLALKYDLKEYELVLKGFCGALSKEKIFSPAEGDVFVNDTDGEKDNENILQSPSQTAEKNIFITINYFADKREKNYLKKKYEKKYKNKNLYCDMESFYFVQYALKKGLKFSVKKTVIDNIKSFVPSGAYLQKLRSFKSMPLKNKIFVLTDIKNLTAFFSLYFKMKVYFLKALFHRKRYLQNG